MSKGSPALTTRATGALFDVVDQARQSAARGAAIRALILLGADRAGYDLSAADRELALLMAEPLDEPVMAALRDLLGTIAPARSQRRERPSIQPRVTTPSSQRAAPDGDDEPALGAVLVEETVEDPLELGEDI